ncbi:putative membrane protein [Halobacteriovorax marinus SJ]|uniref:Membrane protein n=1 Tax=Halobacteriovorax marinus (strain ATCC BAA-682 / DSM 15412 / SJ) TaxID=862908 RepID=E1X0T0_HALMS|nr:hypothetical protein [Halobacteriovorax marinus]CBW26418.1 putative membrane protein [Halobacteriovorax marinus SJ]
MNLKNIFNILLLSISLTTIIVTLVTYIIFKLRLGASKKSFLKNPLEGAFFRRFSPLIQADYLEKKALQEQSEGKGVSFKVKFVSLSFFLFAVISGLILFEDYFKYREQLAQRVTSASKLRELVKRGHLKTYDYVPREEKVVLRKRPSTNTQRQIDYFQKSLGEKKFCLISTYRAKNYDSSYHLNAIKQWREFFKRNKLSYRVYSRVNTPLGCISIYPHIQSLSNSQREELLKSQNPILITGGLGRLDGLGGESKDNILAQLLSTTILADESRNPTLIASEKEYLWDIEGGSFVEWLPLDKRYSHIGEDGGSLLTSSYNGEVFSRESHSFRREWKSKNRVWSSLDPINDFHSDIVFLTIFSKLVQTPIAKIKTFPFEQRAVSFVYRQLSTTDQLDEVKKSLKAFNGSWTLFTRDDRYPAAEIHSEDHTGYEVGMLILEDDILDEVDTRLTFNRVEEMRLFLEELSFSAVGGMATHNDYFSNTLLVVSDQNRLSYIYGKNKFISYSPFYLENLSYSLIPRMFKTVGKLLQDKSISNESEMVNTLQKNIDHAQDLGVAAIVDFSSTDIENLLFSKSLKKLITQNNIKALKLMDLIKYRNEQENLKVAINSSVEEITITNTLSKSVKDIVLLLEIGGKREKVFIKEIAAGADLKLDKGTYLER